MIDVGDNRDIAQGAGHETAFVKQGRTRTRGGMTPGKPRQRKALRYPDANDGIGAPLPFCVRCGKRRFWQSCATSRISGGFAGGHLTSDKALQIRTVRACQGDMMELIVTPYRKLYLAIAGRSTRTQFWSFTFYYIAIITLFYVGIFVLTFLSVLNAGPGKFDPAIIASSMGFLLLLCIPFLIWIYPTALAQFALTCRRLHDQDRSAWYVLIGFIPLIGWLIMFVLMLIPGTGGENRYGSDPREGEVSPDVFG